MAAVIGTGDDFGGTALPASLGSRSEKQEFQQLVLTCNKDGMDFLRKGLYKQAFEQLKYAEAVLSDKQGDEEPTNLLAVTCNNLGCYYKKVGKLHAALSYLRKALKIEISLQTDDVTVAGTHLNICAILSKLDKHDKAVQHATCALELIGSRVSSAGAEAASQDDFSVLAIAYHNVAVERDFMHQWDQAAAAYQQGHQVARRCLGDQHPLTQTLAKNSEAAQQKAQKFGGGGKDRSGTTAPPAAPAPASPAPQGRRNSSKPPMPPGADSGKGSSTPRLPEIGAGGGPVHEKEEPAAWRGPHQMGAAHQKEEPPSWRGPPTLGAVHEKDEPAGWRGPPVGALPPLQSPRMFSHGPAQSLGPSQSGLQSVDVPSSTWGAPPPTMYSNSYGDEGAVPRAAPPSVPVAPPPLGRPSSPPPLVVMGGRQRPRQASREKQSTGYPEVESNEPPPVQVVQRGGRPPRGDKLATARAQREARNAGGLAAVVAGRTEGKDDSKLLRKTAAVKIQKAWRAYRQRKKEIAGRSALEHKSATKIQARWRAFHVRRTKLNKASTVIQKWARGFLTRLRLKRKRAATIIQRNFAGARVRWQLRKQHECATKLQSMVRRRQAVRRLQELKVLRAKALIIVQRFCKKLLLRLRVLQQRKEREMEQAMDEAATKIQTMYRCRKARGRRASLQRRMLEEEKRQQAATAVQTAVRKREAKKSVEEMRQRKKREMNHAATTIRKYWLRYIHRRKYVERLATFRIHILAVVTIQRYVRGYVVRLRMWREALRAEEEAWAALEIQRCWRGYLGRLKWAAEYEAVWSRDTAVRKLQRYIRGWLARTRVRRMRKWQARKEFEKARRRFKAAQTIQALARGVAARRRVEAFRGRKAQAATTIQKVFRGRKQRTIMRNEVVHRKVVKMQALARSFLVRNRRYKLLAQVVLIQRFYRKRLRTVAPERRRQQLEGRRRDREAAAAAPGAPQEV